MYTHTHTQAHTHTHIYTHPNQYLLESNCHHHSFSIVLQCVAVRCSKMRCVAVYIYMYWLQGHCCEYKEMVVKHTHNTYCVYASVCVCVCMYVCVCICACMCESICVCVCVFLWGLKVVIKCVRVRVCVCLDVSIL